MDSFDNKTSVGHLLNTIVTEMTTSVRYGRVEDASLLSQIYQRVISASHPLLVPQSVNIIDDGE